MARWLELQSLQAEILVRFMRTGLLRDDTLAGRARSILSPAERMAWARLRAPVARRDYLGAHVLARLMVAEVAGCDPARVVIRHSALGCPEVVAPLVATRYSVSVSHADGVALCGVAEECDIGVDVESLDSIGPDPLAAAETVCTGRELARLRSLPAELLRSRFLDLWTRKEALAKAHGVGFGCAAGAIATDAGVAWRPPAPVEEESDMDPASGRVESLRLTSRHMAAIAILGVPRVAIGIRLEEVAPEATTSAAPLRA
jgi:4'-phosphopantetheinyl transferase